MEKGDPRIPLQKEDVDYYRYHPLALNAAFLGGLTPDQMKLMGFGSKAQYQPNYIRKPARPLIHAALTGLNALDVTLSPWLRRARDKVLSLAARAKPTP